MLQRLREHEAATGPDRPPPDASESVDLPSAFSFEPKRHKDSAFLAAKQARLWEGHVAPINQLVDRIRLEIAQEWAQAHLSDAPRSSCPTWTQTLAGSRPGSCSCWSRPLARPRWLGDALGRQRRRDGQERLDVLSSNRYASHLWAGWNAVPWYVGDGKRNRTVTSIRMWPVAWSTCGSCSTLPRTSGSYSLWVSRRKPPWRAHTTCWVSRDPRDQRATSQSHPSGGHTRALPRGVQRGCGRGIRGGVAGVTHSCRPRPFDEGNWRRSDARGTTDGPYQSMRLLRRRLPIAMVLVPGAI